MHSTLRFRSWHTLYTVDTALILQRAINISTADGKVYFFISSYGSFRDTGNGELPPLGVAEAFVHLEEVASKEASLVAPRPGTDFHLYVLGIFRIFWDECNLYFLLQFGLHRFVFRQFLACHLLQVGVTLIGEDILRLAYAIQTGDVALACIHYVTKVLIFLSEFHEAILVGYHTWVGNQRRYLLETCLQSVKLL